MMSDILLDESCYGIIIDVGMPVMHNGIRYNARVIALDGKICFIRPKQDLAGTGNYREMRWFTPWKKNMLDSYDLRRDLPDELLQKQDSITVPIGDCILDAIDCSISAETCEELFTPQSPHGALTLAGADIICNSSGSHHELRKLNTRINLIKEATAKCGGVYLYANQQGCDGDRLYYDGCAMIIVNGTIRAQGSQFSLNEVEVVTCTVDLEEVWAYRASPSRGLQALNIPPYHREKVDYRLSPPDNAFDRDIRPSPARPLVTHVPESEIANGPACWLWDYLRHSKAAGFFIPLSGGLDSCSTATLVYSMCRIVVAALQEGNEQVRKDVERIAGPYHPKGWLPKDAQELCGSILSTAYLPNTQQSSSETRDRAQRLAQDIGADHIVVPIDPIFHTFQDVFEKGNDFKPSFSGTPTEDLALQNLQARIRLVVSYMQAQLRPTVRQRPGGGGLLVLGSGNVDECLRGYLTKYDCSSADINPIGSISKVDLRRFLTWAAVEFKLPILDEFVSATPTAELRPITEDYVQDDETDMGMTYAELSTFGRLRKCDKLGPYGMFMRLSSDWHDKPIREVADKVKRFTHFYQINRHKMTVMTPAYHAESYSPDDNRFDLRPFLYPAFWNSWSFVKIDEAVEKMEKKAQEKADAVVKK
jgi:NAD+ synthase (glutamine-hydrolysing)